MQSMLHPAYANEINRRHAELARAHQARRPSRTGRFGWRRRGGAERGAYLTAAEAR